MSDQIKVDVSLMRALADAGLDLIPLHNYAKTKTGTKKSKQKQPDGSVVETIETKIIELGKAPTEGKWQEKLYNVEAVLSYARSQNANVGIRLGKLDVVIDVDHRHFGPTDATKDLPKDEQVPYTLDTPGNPFERFCQDFGISLDEHFHQVTGSGGYHIFLKLPDQVQVANGLEAYPGIEFKAHGRQIVAAGSIHPTTKMLYTFDDPFELRYDLQICPPGLFGAIRKGMNSPKPTERPGVEKGAPGGADSKLNKAKVNAAQVRELLELFDIQGDGTKDTYEDFFAVVSGCHHASDGDLDVMQEVLLWADAGADIAGKWGGLGNYAGPRATFRSVGYMARKYCAPNNLPLVQQVLADIAAQIEFSNDPDDPDTDPDDPHGINHLTKGEKPTIIMTGHNRNQVIRETALHLFDAMGQSDLFYRGSELVSVTQIGGDVATNVPGEEQITWTKDHKGRLCFERNGVRIYPGATVVTVVNGTMMRYYAGEYVEYKRPNTRARKVKDESAPDAPPIYQLMPIDAPIDVKDLTDMPSLWPFYELKALASTPLLNFETGDVMVIPGMMPGSGVLARFDPAAFPEIRNDLTQEEAQAKLEWVHETLFTHFPFEGGKRGASAAVNLTACLCALQRPVMDRGAPLHAFDAPQASSGKSKLTESHGVLATGAIPSMVTWANNEEENNKRLGAALRRAPQVLVFDNLEAKNGDALQFSHMNTAVTATKVTVRILGKSEDVEMPSLTFFEASGNNIVVVGDMTSRVVKCRIDAKMAHPDKRVFEFDPVERALAMRGEIVSALLSVLASYIKSGKPVDNELLPMRFGDAWRAVQGAVVWCGWEDPVKTVDEVRATDEHAAMANEAAELWAEVFGDEWISTSDLMDYYIEKSSKKDEEGEVADLSPIFEVIVTSTASASAMSRSLKDGAVFGEYVLRATKRETGRLKEKMVRLVRQE